MDSLKTKTFVAALLSILHVAASYQVKELLVSRQLYVYKEYKDVQILHFTIPDFVSLASFNLTSNGTSFCGTRNVSVYLQAHTYPVINPNGAKFSPHMWVNRQSTYNVSLLSDLTPSYLNVNGPIPGNWFMVAFLHDASKRIKQAGLFPSCYSWIQVEVTYTVERNVPVIALGTGSDNNSTSKFDIKQLTYLRFFASEELWGVEMTFSDCKALEQTNSSNGCELIVRSRAKGLPISGTSQLQEVYCEPNTSCSINLNPIEKGWNYLSIDALHKEISIEILFTPTSCGEGHFCGTLEPKDVEGAQSVESRPRKSVHDQISDDQQFNNMSTDFVEAQLDLYSNETQTSYSLPQFGSCWPRYQLRRRTFAGNFAFEYDLNPNENGSVALMLNLTNHKPTMLTFEVNPLTDIGGTLSVELAVSPFMNTSGHNISLMGCLSMGRQSDFDIKEDSRMECSAGYTLRSNSSHPEHFADVVLVPYPRPGTWYLTLLPSCFLANHSERVECSDNQTAIIFSVSSASCLHGKCGRNGACFQYISGGFIFSTCSCMAGYQGWACTDAIEAVPEWKLLLSTLLLTLSNVVFLPAILLALYRHYYTEALVYTFTMFFSTFYHACDQSAYKWCTMPLTVLQFGDFYSAIMSFWVTLIAMAKLPQTAYSLLHMIGALMVALGCEYNRTGLWVFAIPALSAVLIMIVAWAYHSKKEKNCFPPQQYWLFSLLPGTTLAVVGLVCYAFFETEDNYYVIHSLWHSIMALSILFLLPPRFPRQEPTHELRVSVEEGAPRSSEAVTLTNNLDH